MKKLLVRLFAGLLAVYAGWTVWQAASFKRYATDGSPALSGPPFEIEGAYHMHTRFSDGRKDPDEVAAAAEAAGLDFVILTDHGNPNYRLARRAGPQIAGAGPGRLGDVDQPRPSRRPGLQAARAGDDLLPSGRGRRGRSRRPRGLHGDRPSLFQDALVVGRRASSTTGSRSSTATA